MSHMSSAECLTWFLVILIALLVLVSNIDDEKSPYNYCPHCGTEIRFNNEN